MGGRRFVAMVRGYVLPSMQISRVCLTILKNRQDELRQMRKTSLEACFNSSLGNRDKDLRFCQNFLRRKNASMTHEQQKVVDEWEEKICGDGAGLCPAIDADFTRLLTILENRQDELRQMRKTSLEACFNSSLGNRDKDLRFCQNFLRRKKASMTHEQQKVVDEWEEKICGDGAGLCPAIDADFTRLLTILENREDELRQMRKTSLEACFNSSLGNRDKDLRFCQNFLRRKNASMTHEQQKVVDEWEEKICGDGAGLCPAIDADFTRLLTILENRQDELRQMRKTSLEACFNSSLGNRDKDLRFCQNFLRRKNASMTHEQQKVVDEWEEKICGDGAGLCPAIDADFTRLLTILENREDDLRQMRKTSLEACFQPRVSNADNDLGFGRNFFLSAEIYVDGMSSTRFLRTGLPRFVAMSMLMMAFGAFFQLCMLEHRTCLPCANVTWKASFRPIFAKKIRSWNFVKTFGGAVQKNWVPSKRNKWKMWGTKCEMWTVKYEVWSVKCEVWTVQCEVWSLKCEVWSVREAVRSVKCGVGSLEWEGSSEKWEVWSLECEECSVQCEVWSVEGRTRSGQGVFEL